MKRLFCLLLCIALVFVFSSCSKKSNESDIDDSYLEGLERGERDMFLNLWQASSYPKMLTYGETWETEYFSLSFTDYMTPSTVSYGPSEVHTLKCKLTLNNFTIDEGLENKDIYFGMYSYSTPGEWEVIVADYDHYYMYAICEDDYTFGSYTSSPSFELYDNQQYVAAIIVVDGNLYKIGYRLNVE